MDGRRNERRDGEWFLLRVWSLHASPGLWRARSVLRRRLAGLARPFRRRLWVDDRALLERARRSQPRLRPQRHAGIRTAARAGNRAHATRADADRSRALEFGAQGRLKVLSAGEQIGDGRPSMTLKQRVALIGVAVAAYLVGFWPSWRVRDFVLSAFDNPPYEGVWILIPHVFLYATLQALFCLVAWSVL